MTSHPKQIERYVTPEGKIPFDHWYDSLRDKKAQYKIDARLERVQLGNIGDYRSVGEGVFELKIDYGPGYRIYFAQIGSKIILLFCGGNKSTQNKDIHQAKQYWRHYEKRH
jgi:putative addiction module killer protein